MLDVAETDASDRAISTKLGVIITIAVLVVLAVVIATFVLGDGTEKPSIATEERSVFYANYVGGAVRKVNLTQVAFRHDGGDAVDVRRLRIKTEGKPGAFGPTDPNAANIADPRKHTYIRNYPDHVPVLGSSDTVEFTAGEAMPVWTSGTRPPDEFLGSRYAGQKSGTATTEGWPANKPLISAWPGSGGNKPCISGSNDANDDPSESEGNYWLNFKGGQPAVCDEKPVRGKLLTQGTGMRVVWTAASGEETQILHRHTVNRTLEDF